MLEQSLSSPSSEASHWALWGLASRNRLDASTGFQEALGHLTTKPLLAEILDHNWGVGPGQQETRRWQLSAGHTLKVCWLEGNAESETLLLLQMQEGRLGRSSTLTRQQIRPQLLMVILPRFLLQLKKHLSNVQDIGSLFHQAVQEEDSAAVARCNERVMKGIQGAADLLNSIVTVLVELHDAKRDRPTSLSREAIVSQLLKMLSPRFLHQLKNHLSVVQNIDGVLKRAKEAGDPVKMSRCHELGSKGIERSVGLLNTIVSLPSMQLDSIFKTFRQRFQAAGITLEMEGELPIGDLWLAALVISLEFARPQMPQDSALRISCEKHAVHIRVEGLESAKAPPLQSSFFEEYFKCKVEGVGWILTSRGGGA